MVSILSNAGSQVDGLLSIGRRLAPAGAPGLSSRARQMTQSYLSQSAAGANQLFSASSSGAYLSVDDLQTIIKGLRSRIPDTQRIADYRSENLDENGDVIEAASDEATEETVKTAEEMLANLTRGSVVNTEA